MSYDLLKEALMSSKLPSHSLTDLHADGGRQGETVPITYAGLVKIFGKPQYEINDDDDDDGDGKVSTEWCIKFSDGVLARIYDYKETSLYERGNPTPAQYRKQSNNWSIGGSMNWHTGMGKIESPAFVNVNAAIISTWSKDKIIKTLLNMIKNPHPYAHLGMGGVPSPSDVIAIARKAGKDYPEFAAVEKSLNATKKK